MNHFLLRFLIVQGLKGHRNPSGLTFILATYRRDKKHPFLSNAIKFWEIRNTKFDKMPNVTSAHLRVRFTNK